MMRLLRRIAVLALVCAAILLTVPRALFHFGLLGPSSAQRVAAARQAVQVARGYGAKPAVIPAMAAAERELARAEELLARKQEHEARQAAGRAQELAGEAQQAAIIGRDAMRLKAKQVVENLDHRIDELEDIYSVRSKGVGADRARHLFSRMKNARAVSAALVLAWEQQDYDTVVSGEGKAIAALDEMKSELEAGSR
jgi:hypothetical protein